MRACAGSREFVYRGRTGTLARFEHRPAGPVTRITSTARLLAELPYFARNNVIKIALRRGWGGVGRALGHVGSHDPY